MKRRPTAADRDFASCIRDLEPGRYGIRVEVETGGAVLKPEGAMIYRTSGKVITIVRLDK